MNVILSVVVFSYNHEKYIQKCIDSVLKQKTSFEYEVIIADDCSEDATLEIIEKRYGNRVRILKREKNVGLCKNMYEAFMDAQGQYIFECSGDDYLLTDRVFEKHIDFLDSHNDFFSVFNWMVFRNENTGNEKIIKYPYSEYTLLDFLKGIPARFYLGTIRNTFKSDNIKYLYEASKNNEEIQMLYYTLSKGKKAIIPEAMYVYCYRSGGDGSNYCSFNDNLRALEDYVQGYAIVEKIDKGKHNFNISKLNYYEGNIDRILQTREIKKIIKIFTVLRWNEVLSFVGLKLLLKLNHYRLPNFLLKEKRLVRQEVEVDECRL